MLVQIGLIRRYVFGILDSVGCGILSFSVRSTGEEARMGAFGMRIGEPVMRMGGRFGTESGDIAIAGSVLTKDIVEASLGVHKVLLIACPPIGIQTLYTAPATSLGVTAPEEIGFLIAIGTAENGVLDFVEIRLEVLQ